MGRTITWQNVADGYELHIDRLKHNMLEEPENGLFWNKELGIAIECKKEALELAEKERHETAYF